MCAMSDMYMNCMDNHFCVFDVDCYNRNRILQSFKTSNTPHMGAHAFTHSIPSEESDSGEDIGYFSDMDDPRDHFIVSDDDSYSLSSANL